MLREHYSIITVTFALATIQAGLVRPETSGQKQPQMQYQQQHEHEQLHENVHPEVLFHHKIWIRDTEFVERDNWRNGLKPCTLLERIKMNEKSVVSMGDAMDAIGGALESNIRDFVLAMDGVLLLEEDTFGDDPLDRMFVQYLSEHGECVSSDTSAKLNQQLDTSLDGDDSERQFEFQPDSDSMSWFNPDNWVSALDANQFWDAWIPEAHRIPCQDDTVIFGLRDAALMLSLDGSERSKTVSFKINFKSSKWKDVSTNISVDSIRVGRLIIGEELYDQHDFEQLLNSHIYQDILFEFDGESSVFRLEDGYAYPSQSLLLIDPSSVQLDGSRYCMDEAGCVCGNEDTKIMEIICSFHLPIDEQDQPCYDPIPVTGYCSKICATTVIVSMDPMKFSEQLIDDELRQLQETDLYAGTVLIAHRRISDGKYEITFRLAPYDIDFTSESSSLEYENIIGREREIAQMFLDKINKPATKSFYGIKSLNVKSSVNWRVNNRGYIFYCSFLALLLASLTIFICQDHYDLAIVPDITSHSETFLRRSWISRKVDQILTSRRIATEKSDDEIGNFDRCLDPNIIDDSDAGSISEIALIKLESTTIKENVLSFDATTDK